MQYRRAFTPGGSFFFTLVTQERRPVFSSADAVETLPSFRRHVEAGVYPANWGENVIEFKGVGKE
ncbi:MAG: hypothetical protein Q8K05_07285 [Polaromonas sp.]|jgi:REP element-mobilizing transposase RayT|uniref:hypothetical protein n=1 Tax=Polaromonas sp. TaxID=1869339 RepID=UPI002730FDFA|nr:hypothetical protein [Polaromonas sp.]MDP2255845.1 hypothetical protein [Polaromonas sp.]